MEMHNIFIYVFVSDTLVGKTMFRNVLRHCSASLSIISNTCGQ